MLKRLKTVIEFFDISIFSLYIVLLLMFLVTLVVANLESNALYSTIFALLAIAIVMLNTFDTVGHLIMSWFKVSNHEPIILDIIAVVANLAMLASGLTLLVSLPAVIILLYIWTKERNN